MLFPETGVVTQMVLSALRASPVLSNKASSGVMEPISEGASG